MPNSYRTAIADDNHNDLFCLRRLLENAGYQVVAEARSGEELIERCSATSPEILITDVRMSGIDGLSAAKKVMEMLNIPIILASAQFDDQLIDRANVCGVFGYLIKPVRREDLAATIRMAVHRFQEFHLLRQEALDARQALEDRKDIERAKGILMRKRNLDEPSAFQQLQQLARAHRKKLIDVAKSIVLAGEVFDQPS